ncbi:MAG TPA: inositol monophosphatase family protein [Thermoanaerobaculia bacterium]|nr:inositol monophosphatase family protein [Thermoanaerobaculia bacterium]
MTLLETAMAAARSGGEVLVANWRNLPHGSVEEKTKNDFVTHADRESEERIVAAIRAQYPEDAFLGEEGGRRQGSAGARVWIIDPLDGTSNFVAGFPFWCVSIAAWEGEELVAGVVWDPLRDEMYTAERGGGAWRNGTRLAVTGRKGLDGAFIATGFPFRNRGKIDTYLALFKAVFGEARAIRRAGSAALDLAYVAAGVFDGFFEFRLAPWDVAAGALLIDEAGGQITDFDGGKGYLERGNVVAGAPGVAEGLRAVAKGIVSELSI